MSPRTGADHEGDGRGPTVDQTVILMILAPI
jgi:hypothetical protein